MPVPSSALSVETLRRCLVARPTKTALAGRALGFGTVPIQQFESVDFDVRDAIDRMNAEPRGRRLCQTQPGVVAGFDEDHGTQDSAVKRTMRTIAADPAEVRAARAFFHVAHPGSQVSTSEPMPTRPVAPRPDRRTRHSSRRVPPGGRSRGSAGGNRGQCSCRCRLAPSRRAAPGRTPDFEPSRLFNCRKSPLTGPVPHQPCRRKVLHVHFSA